MRACPPESACPPELPAPRIYLKLEVKIYDRVEVQVGMATLERFCFLFSQWKKGKVKKNLREDATKKAFDLYLDDDASTRGKKKKRKEDMCHIFLLSFVCPRGGDDT